MLRKYTFQSGNNSHFPVSVSDELTGQILQAAKDADTRSVVIPNREYLVVGRTLNRSGWCIAGVISRRYLAQSTKELTTILLLVLLIIAFSALYISPAYLPVCIPPHSDSLYYDGGGRSRGFFRSLFGTSRR